MREWEGRECYKRTTAEVVANLMRFLHLTPKNGSDAQSAGRSKAKKSVDESDNKSNDEVIRSLRFTAPRRSKPWNKRSRRVTA